MKTARILSVLLFVFLVFVLIQPVDAGQKTIAIPKGSKNEQVRYILDAVVSGNVFYLQVYRDRDVFRVTHVGP